jgi:oligopeptide transport system permease protein
MNEITTPAIAGRSLWADAQARLVRNKAAVASLIGLALMALACLFGPYLTGHDYDRVYPDYVKVTASILHHPDDNALQSAADKVAGRMRVKAALVRPGEAIVGIELVAPRAIDERNLALFERSDMFHAAKITERHDEGRRFVIEVPVERHYFLFGTDGNGRDLLTRTLVAGRVSLAIGLLATFIAILIGVTYGAIAGYFGGRIDMLMMRAVDVLYSLPFIFFVIMLVVFFGRNFVLMFLAVGAVEWLDMARIVRGLTLSLKNREFVQAAEVLGVPASGILKRHIIPNTLGPVIVYTTLLVPKVILLESFLSFLGLGVQEPMTSWGVLISDGARNIQGSTYLLVFPALFLILTLSALNFLGDGLRDALDPRDR